ncbi:O-antigen ligase family protein [Paenibacillus sp. V4I7]|uniref:O-antigen ligase family protein n=1 Tax=Paenibacillus sp. V4I7 TaxID=3042307 RepID=UPI0027D86A92|nr:O-antigen ligase family protein [Paenibacillus sp. V4I7]
MTILLVGMALAVSLLIGYSSATLSPDLSMQIAFLSILLFPAFVMALLDSRRLIPYILLVWVICPEIRRIQDWMEGTYHSVSLLSIAPLLTSAVVIIPILSKLHQMDSRINKLLLYMAIVLLYGSLIGLTKNGSGALYDLANYFIPLLLIPYAALSKFDSKALDRLLIAFSNTAILIAVYGIIQYVLVPPWDAFWMNHVEMTSIGKPLPLEIRVFSTLNSPGPAGTYLASALAPMILDKRWRGPLGWIGVILVTVGLLITLVRSAWVMLFIDIVIYTAVSAGRQKWKLIAQLTAVIGAMYVIIPKLPGAQGLVERLNTMTAIQDDHSYNERLDFFHTVFPILFAKPQGLGLGSIGVGTKLSNGGALGEYGIFDNGFVAMFLTFGILGGLLFFWVLWLVTRFLLSQKKHTGGLNLYSKIALSALLGSIICLVFENGYTGLKGFLLWMVVGVGIMAHHTIVQERRQIPDAATSQLENSPHKASIRLH